MKLDTVRAVSEADGPFATVYLESGSPSEDAPTQFRLRWEEQRRQLAADGAGEDVLGVLDSALRGSDSGDSGDSGDFRELQAEGRVLVATADGVLLDESWDASPGAGDSSDFGPVPELSAYVRERASAVRVLLAVVDQTGAVVRRLIAGRSPDELSTQAENVVESSSDVPVRKPRQGALSHNQIQRRADEAVKQNARGVAEHLDGVARRWRPDVLVLAGEAQGRTAVREELSTALAGIVQETDEGGLAETGGENAGEALDRVVGEIASELAAGVALAQTDRLEEARARGRAAEGRHEVVQAAGLGAVATLLLGTGPPAQGESETVVSAAQTDAEVALIDQPVADNIAAVLRFEAPDELGEPELNG